MSRDTPIVAISNNRLLDTDQGKVRFNWKDYRNGNQQKTMTLAPTGQARGLKAHDEFIRRFLLHIFPKAFNASAVTASWPIAIASRRRRGVVNFLPCCKCPACQRGHMVIIEVLRPPNHVARSTTLHDAR